MACDGRTETGGGETRGGEAVLERRLRPLVATLALLPDGGEGVVEEGVVEEGVVEEGAEATAEEDEEEVPGPCPVPVFFMPTFFFVVVLEAEGGRRRGDRQTSSGWH